MNKSNFLNSCSISFPMFLHYWFILICIMSKNSSATPSYGNVSDLMALLDFKNLISEDPSGTMKLWNHSVHFCNWFGITCAPRNQRVVILSLQNQGLVGSLPLSIGNLTHLTHLNLSNNDFRGEIPREIGRLVSLRNLSLSYNSFGGKIPENISHCKELRVLSLSKNQLVGTIPDQLRSLTMLTFFGIGANKHSGKIPAWIGNFSSLSVLFLAVNNLHGVIPAELGRLTNLQMLLLWDNNLDGVFPHSIYNISSIFYFTVAQNLLEGELPKDIGMTLPKLEVFACGANQFTGNVPESLSNASKLQLLDVSENGLSGALPLGIGRLRDLSWLDVSDNRLVNGKPGGLNIVNLLVNCTGLELLDLAGNFFGGELPKSIANLSTQVRTLLMGSTMIYGEIPKGIGNLVNLVSLGLEGNHLTGNIPVEIGKLNKLNALNLNVNKFSGSIPSSLSNLTSLIRVFMEKNRLDGAIPPSLGRLRNLLVLNLSSNNLNGSIPREIMEISSFSISLTLSNNYLTGSLPSEVGELSNLLELDVSRNKLTGEIPSSLGECHSLSKLKLEHNEFEGKIPESLKSLRGLEYIDLSNNNFSGNVPEFLTQFPFLKHLDIARNNFEGELSKEGIFSNASAVSVLGNDRLCGGVIELHLPECPHERENKHSWRKIFSMKVLIPLVSAASVTILVSLFYFCLVFRESKKTSSTSSSKEEWSFQVSYFDLAESTNGFATANLIGSGSFGSVYKGILGVDRELVAVKVLNLQIQGALKSFFKECSALRSVRHRNLLKIITACSSIDHQGNDFRSLVFEYMANGNLDEWLHRRNEERTRLNFIQRLNIAIDVASALDYLHNHTETPIVHCDLKPSNVLLDHDMVAHVGDFGLASFLFEASENAPKNQTFSVALKGSTGYIPPEYGMGGKVSVLGDSYSYGILLLEMFIGKRPTDEFFEENLSIHQFVSRAFPDRIMDIVDSSLMVFEENEGERNESDIEEQAIIEAKRDKVNCDKRIDEFLVSIMQIGLSCSNGSPKERLLMSDVLNKMVSIRDSYLKSNNTKQ